MAKKLVTPEQLYNKLKRLEREVKKQSAIADSAKAELVRLSIEMKTYLQMLTAALGDSPS